MAKSNSRGGRNNNPGGRNQYSDWSMMDMVRERPFAAAATAAGAAAAGLFLWSKRAQISDQLSSLSDQFGQWTEDLRSADDGSDSETASRSNPSARRTSSARNKSAQTETVSPDEIPAT